jgi:hypothetical protein
MLPYRCIDLIVVETLPLPASNNYQASLVSLDVTGSVSLPLEDPLDREYIGSRGSVLNLPSLVVEQSCILFIHCKLPLLSFGTCESFLHRHWLRLKFNNSS